jgi:hypothetical protein
MVEKRGTVCIENALNIILKNPGKPLQRRQRWRMHVGLIFLLAELHRNDAAPPQLLFRGLFL